MLIVASYHHKGGVGKTTTAVALAAHAAASGARTLLWDLDPQGAATRLAGGDRGIDDGVARLFRVGVDLSDHALDTPYRHLELLPADLSLRTLDRDLGTVERAHRRLRSALERTGGRYEVVVLDCPPAVSSVADAILRTAHVVAVPLTAGPLAWSAYADLFLQVAQTAGNDGFAVIDDSDDDGATGSAAAAGRGPQMLAFLTMVDRRKSLHRDLVEGLDESEDGLSSVYVPTDSQVERMALDPLPLRAVLRGRVGHAYRQLWAQVQALGPGPVDPGQQRPARSGSGR